jgi:hypothetical protein
MTLELYRLLDKIEEAAAALVTQQEEYERLAEVALARLAAHSNQLGGLKEKAEHARTTLGGIWRGALPTFEPIGQAYPPPRPIAPVNHVIAADGSQIFPDRHGIAYYALINIGAIHTRPGSGEAPDEITFPDLIFGSQLRGEETAEPLQAAEVSRERDKQELSRLIDLSARQEDGAVALMDSPLVLWILGTEPGQRSDLEAWFIAQLRRARDAGVSLAGYVDRPGSRGVAELLALAPLDVAEITKDNPAIRAFRDMPDRIIFRRLLAPGERSALFVSGSPFNRILARQDAALEVAFFYINVGTPQDAVIARVETPRWVTDDPVRLGQLHDAIWDQCQAPGRYPYVLARAHEVALVSSDHRIELENLLAHAMLQRGLQPQTSAKSFLKTLTAG